MRVRLETRQDGKSEVREAQEEYLSLMMCENQRMGRILADFLSLARLERNRKTFRMTAVVAAEAVTAMLKSRS